MSGYTSCACRDCFEIAISDTEELDFCNACEDAGCEADSECCVEPELEDDEETQNAGVA